jgi:hypothetical protein
MSNYCVLFACFCNFVKARDCHVFSTTSVFRTEENASDYVIRSAFLIVNMASACGASCAAEVAPCLRRMSLFRTNACAVTCRHGWISDSMAFMS